MTTSKTACKCPPFVQSRNLPHLVAIEWRDRLFELLSTRPIDTLYSIAFSLSFTPIFGIHDASSPSESNGDDGYSSSSDAYFVISRELFDLLDDHVRDTEHQTMAELLNDRPIDRDSFVRANLDYRERSRSLESLLNRYDVFRGGGQRRRDESTNADDDGGGDDLLPADRRDMLDVFEQLNRYGDLLPFIANVNASRTIERFDVNSLKELPSEAILTQPYSSTTNTTTTQSVVAIDAWTPIELYVQYAYVLHRFHSLEPLMRKFCLARGGVEIFPILIPMGSAWQAGTSQLLWILMHTLTSLLVARENLYLTRLLVLLKNLSFFVWCGECAQHWRTNGGNDYFERYSRLPRSVLDRLPIDVVLAQCHNTVASNGRLNRRLTNWTVDQLIIDYREFVEWHVLRRHPCVCNRVECHDAATTTVSSAAPCFPSQRPFYTMENILLLLPADVLRIARGDWQLAKLWYDISDNILIGTL